MLKHHHSRRHSLVMLAISMMVGSALVSFFCVHHNDKKIAELKVQSQQIDETIRSLWDDAGRMDRNTDTAVIISLLAKNDPKEADALTQYYLSRNAKLLVTGSPSLLNMLHAADAERERTANRINDLYIERTSLENDMMSREQANSLFGSIALFLQLAGLVLVILTREMPDL